MMIHLNQQSDSGGGGGSRSNFCIRTEHWTAQHAIWAQHQQNLYCYSCKITKKGKLYPQEGELIGFWKSKHKKYIWENR